MKIRKNWKEITNHQQMMKNITETCQKLSKGKVFHKLEGKKLEGKGKSSTDDEKHVSMPKIKQGEGF